MLRRCRIGLIPVCAVVAGEDFGLLRCNGAGGLIGHAEIRCLSVIDRFKLRECDILCSIEPC